ncbi:MAG: NAD(P)/FAD-dependent oxidoreductase [Bacillota bacterium]
MKRLKDLKVPLDKEYRLKEIAAMKAGINSQAIKTLNIVKKSIDARKKSDIKFIYTIDLSDRKELQKEIIFPKAKKPLNKRPVIIGSGPSGLFCALYLAYAGLNPIIIERGSQVEKRIKDVESFIKTRILNPESNIQFGEGGAGTFSDGKLTTLTKSPYRQDILRIFVKFGAPREILYLNKPHIGTDNLIEIVKNIRKEIESLGGDFYFETYMDEIILFNNKACGVKAEKKEFFSDHIILAIGHSARDTYDMLYKKGVYMEQKEFSVGFRIEHPQNLINLNQYGEKFYNHKALGAADYKFVSHTNTSKSVYTFCMCPGGMVVAATNQKGHVVTNGMSYYKRNSVNANSALLVNIKKEDMPSQDPLCGINLQQKFERKAYLWGGENYNAPVQLVGDFLKGVLSKDFGRVLPSYPLGVTLSALHEFYDKELYESFSFAINDISRKMECFNMYDAILTAPETRSSSPVRISRDQNFESISTKNLYPLGEGCGYAGGIMSSAADGVKLATKIIESLN